MNTTPRLVSDMGLAYSKTGVGPALILIHGWPFHSDSFRKIIPQLATQFTCYALDSMGMGESKVVPGADFSFNGHAQRVIAFTQELGLKTYAILGHDTGGTVARMVAAQAPEQVQQVIIMDTEMPGHMPTIVPQYQMLLRFGLARFIFKQVLKSKRLGRSNLGLRVCFYQPENISDEFLDLFFAYWAQTPQRLDGLVQYLMGVNHEEIDALRQVHQKISAPILVLWGQKDRIFPLKLAQDMVDSMPSGTQFQVLADAGFLVHEEKPELVSQHIIDFLSTAPKQQLAS